MTTKVYFFRHLTIEFTRTSLEAVQVRMAAVQVEMKDSSPEVI